MTKPIRLRTTLSATTILAAGLMLAAAPARAQSLPDTGNVTSVTSGLSGGAPGSTNPTFSTSGAPGAQTLQVDLRDNRTILNWGGSGFNVAAGNTVDFKDARAVSGVTGRTDNIAVLNRTTGPGQAIISGTLRSDPNVAVYLISQGGVFFGANSAVDTGSFFAGTSNLSNDNDFLNASTTLRFSSGGGGDVSVGPSTQFTTRASASADGGRMGDFVLMGSRIHLNSYGGARPIVNAGGDAALIVARDVTMISQPGSPLSFTIHAGSTFVDARATIEGDITARNITIVNARAGNVTSPILKHIDVQGSLIATGALQTDRGIVLTTGGNAPGVTMGVTPGTDYNAVILSGGTVAQTAGGSLNSAKNLFVNATSFSANNAIVVSDHAEFQASTSLGALTAATVKLHSDFSASGKVKITNGDLVLNAPTGLPNFFGDVEVAGDFNVTASGFTLHANATIGGSLIVNSVGSLNLFGSSTRAASINLRATGLNGYVQLGGNLVSTSGDISVRSAYTLFANNVTSAGALYLQGDFGLTATSLTGASVQLASGASPYGNPEKGTLTVGSATATTGNVEIAGHTVSVTSAAAANGNIAIQSAGNVSVGGNTAAGIITAGGDISVMAGGVAGTAALRGTVTAGGNLSVTAPSTVTFGNPSGPASSIKAKGAVTATSQTGMVRGIGGLLLQSNSDGVGAEALTLSAASSVSFVPPTWLLGGTDRQSDIRIRSGANSSVAVANLSARSLLSATGSDPFSSGIVRNAPIGFLGQVSLINGLSAQGTSVTVNGPITVTAGNIDLRAASPTSVNAALTASGDISVVTSAGNLTVGANGSFTGGNILLSTPGAFINNGGANIMSGASRWLVYSADPAGNTFGGLDSGNAAIWNATLATRDPSTITGNRYVFAYQPTLTFSTVDFSKVYGTDLTGSSVIPFAVSGYHPGVVGAFLGDTAATAYSGNPLIQSAGFAERASVAGGPYAQTIAVGGLQSASGYAFAFAPSAGLVTVTPKALTGAIAADNKIYDGNTAATGTISLTGVVAGDTVGTAGSVFTFADKNAGTGKTVNVTGTTLTGADSGNYTLSIPAAALADILKRALSAAAIADDKVYDGTTSATGSVTLGGVLAGEDVGTAGTVFTFADKNAGTGKTVNLTGTTLTGADSGNYTLTLPAPVLADILKKTITGTAIADNKVYDGTTAATGSVSLNGLVAGDDVGTGGITFTFSDKNAGNGKSVTVGGSVSGADAGNYTVSLPATVLADILKKAIIASVAAHGKTYDGTTATTGSVALNGVVAGDAVGTAGASFTFADRNAGTGKTVHVAGATLTGADSGNYTLTVPATVIADILKKAITASVAVDSKTYDGTVAATGALTLNGVVSGDNVGRAGTSFAFADKNAGTGKTVHVTGTTLTGGDSGNYTLTIPATALADIAKRGLSITADDKAKYTGDADPALTYTITLGSMVAGDLLTGLLARAAGETPGSYAIDQGTLTAGSNYTIAFTPGALTISVNPATSQQQTLRSVPLPAGVQAPAAEEGGVRVDAEALCAQDASCVAN